MKFLLIILVSICLDARASLTEVFGTSAGAMAIGNQAERDNAANNFYASSLLGFNQTTSYSFSSFYLDTDFHNPGEVLVKNQMVTISGAPENGVPEVNPTPVMMFGANLSTPLFSSRGPMLNASLFAPYDRALEADTGAPYQPRYAMYDTRIVRSVILLSLAKAWGDWSYSLGGQTGFQTNGESYFLTRTDTTNDEKPSLGAVRVNAKPSWALNASLAKRTKTTMTYLSFHEEMKAKLINKASGETDIASHASFPFNLDAISVLYFDPMTVRLGHQSFHTSTDFFYSLEFQRWTTYESPTLRMRMLYSQFNDSVDYESLQLRNILVPKVGMVHRLNDRLALKAGYFYRPTPLKTEALRGAGNTIDVDKHVLTLGSGYSFPVEGTRVTVDAAYQAHYLEYQRVRKDPGREDGFPTQQKIGSPGYPIGGMVHAFSLSISWKI
jgi:long-subunit fatty acid transport protein